MKTKLVEEWLTKARERGGIDLAVGQWLISQGHEVLWLGHSRTEFGKDIVSVDTDGKFHAFQVKDEDINLDEKEQSWAKLRQAAAEDRANELPDVLLKNPEFALMYFLAYPHRISPALVGFLDRHFGRIV